MLCLLGLLRFPVEVEGYRLGCPVREGVSRGERFSEFSVTGNGEIMMSME